MNAETEMAGADGLGGDPLTQTQARDAEIIFHPQATEEERGDAVAELLRLVSNMEHPAVLELAVYDDCRDVELAEPAEPLDAKSLCLAGRECPDCGSHLERDWRCPSCGDYWDELAEEEEAEELGE